MPEQSMQACYSHVAYQLCPLTHNLGRHSCFLCNRKVSRTSSDYRQNRLRLRQLLLLKHNGSGQFLVSGLWKLFRFGQLLEYVFPGSCSQNVIAFGCQTSENFDNLFRSFIGTINNFRKTSPDLPMMVYACKSQVLEWKMPKLFDRLIDAGFTALNLTQ
jgi:hypothetical protein